MTYRGRSRRGKVRVYALESPRLASQPRPKLYARVASLVAKQRQHSQNRPGSRHRKRGHEFQTIRQEAENSHYCRVERTNLRAGVAHAVVQRLSSAHSYAPIDTLALGYEISLRHAKCVAFSPPSQRRWSFLCCERRVYVLRCTQNARSKADVPRLAWTLLLYSTASKPSRNQ